MKLLEENIGKHSGDISLTKSLAGMEGPLHSNSNLPPQTLCLLPGLSPPQAQASPTPLLLPKNKQFTVLIL